MAPSNAASLALLRSASLRISSTAVQDLPRITPQITGLIWNCRDLLSSPTEAKQNTETSIIVHRFRTQLAALLQDRTIQGRWAAVVLVKSTIEAGGIEVLSKCNSWVKSLLGILKKPDPSTTRTLTVLTLTRIFMLTWDYSNLVREITTPALTAFVPACLSNIENIRCSARELEAVLEAFSILLPHHPTIFRTYEAKLRTFLSNILSSQSSGLESGQHYTRTCQDAAGQLLAQLHSCAPKQGSGEKWAEVLKAVTTAAHATSDRIFRAVDEDWQSVAGVQRSSSRSLGADVESESDDATGMKPWRGVYAGGERLISHLKLIHCHMATATSGVVPVRIGDVTDLLTRIFAITQPYAGNQDFIKINNQVSKDEREAMFAMLPDIHIAAMGLCEVIIQRFGSELIAWVQWLTEHMSWVLKAERKTSNIRLASYRLLRNAIAILGPAMARADVAELSRILESCCEDVLPLEQGTPSTGMQNGGGIKQQLGLAGSKTIQSHPTDAIELQKAAIDLLCTVLDRIDAVSLSPKLRAQVDRIAVLSRSESLLFASVMSPHRKQNDPRLQPSLLPILAREFGERAHVEALLRPRMPPLRGKTALALEEHDDIDEDEEVGNECPQHDEITNTAEYESTSIAAIFAPLDDAALAQKAARSQASAQSPSKRLAAEEPESSWSAKRLRASPVAESVLPDEVPSLRGPDPVISQDDAPSMVVVPTNDDEDTVATVQTDIVNSLAGANSSNTTAVKVVGAIQDGSDDSDFEMPPLTMEPDTDPEDEDGDQDQD